MDGIGTTGHGESDSTKMNHQGKEVNGSGLKKTAGQVVKRGKDALKYPMHIQGGISC